MSNINNKNVNNQSSLNVDSIQIDSIEMSNGVINCDELDANLIYASGGFLSYVNLERVNITNSNITANITDSNISNSDISGNISGNISGTISNSNITNCNISDGSSFEGIIINPDIRDLSNNILLSDDVVNGFIINGATLKNRSGLKTVIKMNENNTTIIPSITSYQIFNSVMGNNITQYTSTPKLFQEGVKVINISYSHYATTLGLFDCKCYIKYGAGGTILQTFIRRYHISTINVHYTQSFNFLSTNISTASIYIVVDIIPVGASVFGSTNTQDFITGVMYNLPNIE